MDQVMCVDESAKDDRTPGRKRDWSLIGTCCVQRRCFVCGCQYSILPIITLDGIIMYNIMEGSVMLEKFVHFLWELVVSTLWLVFYLHSNTLQIPLTNPYPGPCSVLIIDNCNIHHTEEVCQLVEDEVGSKMQFIILFILIFPSQVANSFFLPPYSPDYNPIEQVFSSIKAWLWHSNKSGLSAIGEACWNITPDMAVQCKVVPGIRLYVNGYVGTL